MTSLQMKSNNYGTSQNNIPLEKKEKVFNKFEEEDAIDDEIEK